MHTQRFNRYTQYELCFSYQYSMLMYHSSSYQYSMLVHHACTTILIRKKWMLRFQYPVFMHHICMIAVTTNLTLEQSAQSEARQMPM